MHGRMEGALVKKQHKERLSLIAGLDCGLNCWTRLLEEVFVSIFDAFLHACCSQRVL